MGICNGFQILLEAGLLPGVMLKNNSLQFVCKDVYLSIENHDSLFTKGIESDKVLKIPVAHGDGNYFADEATLKSLTENNQIVFRYTSPDGQINAEYNPNGSVMNIAGIINKRGNILGMMPHPERASDPVLGKTDGGIIFNSIGKYIFKLKDKEMFGNIGLPEILIIFRLLFLFSLEQKNSGYSTGNGQRYQRVQKSC